MTAKTINVGLGHRLAGARLPDVFQTDEWLEVRFDIDPAN